MPHEVRLRHLKRLVGECEAETEDDNIKDFYLGMQPAYVFLTGKAASSVSLKNLTEEDSLRFLCRKNGVHGRSLEVLKP